MQEFKAIVAIFRSDCVGVWEIYEEEIAIFVLVVVCD